MTRSERIYRALLRAYPARTRDASGDDMTQLFIDRLRDTTSGREAVVLVPAPALVVVAGPVAASIYAMGVTLLVLVARFKWLMLALVAPFLVWLVAGPVIWAPVLGLLNGLGGTSP